jgi:hypothetical protein
MLYELKSNHDESMAYDIFVGIVLGIATVKGFDYLHPRLVDTNLSDIFYIFVNFRHTVDRMTSIEKELSNVKKQLESNTQQVERAQKEFENGTGPYLRMGSNRSLTLESSLALPPKL